MTDKEIAIEKNMRILNLSREDAEKLYEYDKSVDRMKDSDVNNDLNEEQKAVIKKARQADRTPTVYKFEKRERKPNELKRDIITLLTETLKENNADSIMIANVEREFTFVMNETKFKIVLSCPRS